MQGLEAVEGVLPLPDKWLRLSYPKQVTCLGILAERETQPSRRILPQG